ncbi:hypothetical protein M758_5G123700 [Ceratodon purpureus]|nr:hypothetical protein M758_5G123700 [Ceratodon purpureus]
MEWEHEERNYGVVGSVRRAAHGVWKRRRTIGRAYGFFGILAVCPFAEISCGSLEPRSDGEVGGGELVGGVTRRIAFFVWLTLCCLRLVECQIRRSICTQCSMALEE